MKKQQFILGTLLTMALAGCSDDLTEKGFIPVQTGQEIIFGSAISKDNNTDAQDIEIKTIYGERTETGIPVRWNPEGDTIAIFCPEASAPERKMVNYVVKPDTKDESMDSWNTSAYVEKADLEQAGLQWGTEPEHKFYALYPASRLKDANSDAAANHGRLTFSIPANQVPSMFQGIIDPLTRDSAFYALPDMNNAYMWAHNHVNKNEIKEGSPIHLNFKNMVTVMDITIPGPANANDEVTITNINITSLDENDLMTGDFYFYIKEGGLGHDEGSCEPVPSKTGEVRNRISIPCYDQAKKRFITLKGPNQKLVVKAYLVPDNSQPTYTRNLKITVAMLNGAEKTKTLGAAALTPLKVNRIVLPRIENSTPAYWMSNLDPNIYLTELSIPGSKMSYLTSNNGANAQGGETHNPPFQTKTIPAQFKDGIRAFIVQTSVQSTYKRTGWWTNYKYILDKAEPIYMPVIGARDGKHLENTLDEIIASLKEAPDNSNDFAFLLLTADYSKNSANISVPGGDEQIWIEGAAAKLKALTNDPKYNKYIYSDEITANTTLGDVKGKIVIKINYNSNAQHQYVEKDDRVPALFSLWEAPPSPYRLITTPLYWGTLNGEGVRTQLKWMYQEVTNIPKEAPEQAKIDGVLGIFRESVKEYQKNNNHDTWFMNDLGGAYRSSSGILENEPTTRIAKKFNELAIDALQSRKENASTGIVFMNFADRDRESGGKYKSDYIIATIIDNNFKFALRKKGSN